MRRGKPDEPNYYCAHAVLILDTAAGGGGAQRF